MSELNEDVVKQSFEGYSTLDPAVVTESFKYEPHPVISLGKGASLNQPTGHLTDKTNGTVYGSAISLLVIGTLLQFGIEVNEFLSAGITGVSAIFGSWLLKERRR